MSIALNCGYHYVDDNHVNMVEYHIDASYAFEEQLLLLPFGGNLSVRKPIGSKAVIFIGQDEAILNNSFPSQRCGLARMVKDLFFQRTRKVVQ